MPAFRTTELLQSSKHMSNIVTHQESPDISGSGFWHAEAAIINKGWSHQSKASLEYDSDRGGQADVHHGTRQGMLRTTATVFEIQETYTPVPKRDIWCSDPSLFTRIDIVI